MCKRITQTHQPSLKPKCVEKWPEVDTAVKLVVSMGIPEGAVKGYGSLERWKVG